MYVRGELDKSYLARYYNTTHQVRTRFGFFLTECCLEAAHKKRPYKHELGRLDNSSNF